MNSKINQKKIFSVIAIALMVAFVPKAFAGSVSVNHTVSLAVPTTLAFSANETNFTLTFADYIATSETDTKSVTYTVKANNMTKTAGVVTAKLDALYDNIDFKADVGSYTKTSGNGSLKETAAGFTTITAASAVNLADRQTDSGNGKTVRGTLPITYKATAKEDLSAQTLTGVLTISLIDA